ncbi:hypothetical protein SprV_0401655600 [Sparganum proliferum]
MAARNDQQEHLAETATATEQPSNVGDCQNSTKLSANVSGKLSAMTDSVRDVNGVFIADKSAKADLRRQHFQHPRNFEDQVITPSLSYAVNVHPSPPYAVSCDRPPEGDVADAVQRWHSKRCPQETAFQSKSAILVSIF